MKKSIKREKNYKFLIQFYLLSNLNKNFKKVLSVNKKLFSILKSRDENKIHIFCIYACITKLKLDNDRNSRNSNCHLERLKLKINRLQIKFNFFAAENEVVTFF